MFFLFNGHLWDLQYYILCRFFLESTFLTDFFRMKISLLTDIYRINEKETDIFGSLKYEIADISRMKKMI